MKRAGFAILMLMSCLSCHPTTQDGPQPSAFAEPATEKDPLLQALRGLTADLRKIQTLGSSSESTVKAANRSLLWLGYLETKAVEWVPASADEGRDLRESIERMRLSISDVREQPERLEQQLMLIADDLVDKGEYCTQLGLSSKRQVRVVPKRDGIDEVKGLEVLYIEKFFASNPKAQPKSFPGFSSPVAHDLTPGSYLFWAKQPGQSGKLGERKEIRVALEGPVDPVEVLAP
jgi:hypothetical protein